MSSIGNTCEYPPPVAPPLIPKTGPSEGSRNTAVVRFPMRLRPCAKPIETVVLPSPAGVGDMADTSISLFFAAFSRSMRCSGSFAL